MKLNSYYIKNHLAPIAIGIVIGALIVAALWFGVAIFADAWIGAVTSE